VLVSWYLPILRFSLWPCVGLLLVFIPVSIWHERNWRRTLADYAEARRDAGAADESWPSQALRRAMGVQPWLVFAAAGMLAMMVVIAVWAAVVWPGRPPGFEEPVNVFDLPYLWTTAVAGTAAVIAGVVLALDLAGSPWSHVASCVRRSMYASPDTRAALFARALSADPGVPHEA
jgi:hypothetical protein